MFTAQGHPGLVVHGPPMAMLLLYFAQQQAQARTLTLNAYAPDHTIALSALATLGDVNAHVNDSHLPILA